MSKPSPSAPVFVPSAAPSRLTQALNPLPPAHGGSSLGGASDARRRPTTGTPRAGQAARPKHKTSRRAAARPNVNVDDEYADDAVEQLPRGRRNQVPVTHLLNLTLPPRELGRPAARARPTQAADKARYVNANFRFVVHPAGDFRPQAADPDLAVPWHLIMQVLAWRHTQASGCPICLADEPPAARMGRCGHVYCLPCLIRMVESTAATPAAEGEPKRRNQCPLCFESLSLSDAKPLKWMDAPCDDSGVPAVGRDLTLRLLMRRPGSVLALPRDGGERPPGDDVPWHYAAEVYSWARLMKGSERYMNGEYEREIRELEFAEQEDEASFGDAGEWIHKAIERIVDANEAIAGIGNGGSALPPGSERSRRGRRRAAATSTSPPAPVAASATASAAAEGRPADTPYFFYQPRDASATFLAPLDIKILKTAFGAFGAFPSTLLARVEHVSHGSVDDDVRRRSKYLAHLPLGAPMATLECDWTGVVSSDVLALFSDDLARRRKAWADKEAKEERARQRGLRAAEEQARAVRDSHLLPSHANHYAYIGSENNELEAAALAAVYYESTHGEGDDHSSLVPRSPDDYAHSGVAAAWPSLSPASPAGRFNALGFGSPASPPAGPATATTVWGTPAVSFSRAGGALALDDEGDGDQPDRSDWVDVWTTNELLYEPGTSDHSFSSPTSGSGRKKKNKKLVFGGQRGA
ncbi:uncharacterized protein V1510DRAFT_155793 [Dipodascopsis tothii]|uniref:uncharacterized protein n=1 Tax=Dipodascopsis tothii TaxID=44089 RepID=UPI0034CE455C